MRRRTFNNLRLVLCVSLLTPMVGAFAKPLNAVIVGVASAKDGDDAIVNNVDIRLNGIAAPEDNNAKRDPGGPESTANLGRLIDGRELRCELNGERTRGRPVGICYLNGKDIGELQVLAGHARDCPRYSGGRYADAERTAQSQGRNLSAIYSLPGYCTPR